ELVRASVGLLRAECSVVLAVTTEGDRLEITPFYGELGLPVKRDLVQRAIQRRRAVDWSRRDAADADKSTRSALCVPIVVRGAPWGCLYVTHSEVDELFGEQERQIGEFLGTLAGAALENAAGFSEVTSLSRALEARVAARTAELESANRELEEHL